MIIISDTSILSGLIIVDRIDILTGLFNQVLIPQAVKDELLLLTNYQQEVNSFFDNKQITIKQLSDLNLYNDLSDILEKGEAQAISLSVELNADLLLIDEKKGRTIAQQFGLQITGLLGILLLAKQKKLIDSVKKTMDNLRTKAGFWIGSKLYNKILQKAGEK